MTTQPTPSDIQRIQLLSNRTYDFFKFLSTILLPALGAAYFSLGELLGLPYVTEVVGVLSIVAVLIGTVIKASAPSHQMAKKLTKEVQAKERTQGTIVVSTDEEDRKSLLVEFDGDPYDVDQHQEVTFRVVQR